MDIDKVRHALDKMPVLSEYEFKHLELEAQGSWHRQMRHVLTRKEQMYDELEILSAEISIVSIKLRKLERKVKDRELREAKVRGLTARLNQLQRTAGDITKRMAVIDAWLDLHKPEECLDAAMSFEDSESEHWIEQFGREIGVELLVEKQARKESMMRAALLPLADFKKSVLIMNQFMTFLRKTAEAVEAPLYQPSAPDIPTATPPTADQAEV